MTDPAASIVYVTWPDAPQAAAAARAMVEERLAACAHVLPGGTSIYRWNGAIETDQEWVTLFKTTRDGAAALRARIEAIHPYQVACVLAVQVDAAASGPAYLQWISENVA